MAKPNAGIRVLDIAILIVRFPKGERLVGVEIAAAEKHVPASARLGNFRQGQIAILKHNIFYV